ncbi:MAG: hypothetical protein R6W73_02930 [Candidatus Saliniplasma sp.]
MKNWGRGRIFISFVIVFGGTVLALALRSGEILLSIMTVAYLILMYYIDKIEPEPYRDMDLEKLKIDLFLWSLFPMIFGAFGAAGILDLHFYFVFRDIAFTALASVLAFMIILNMDSHTDFRPNRLFTVSFIIITTIGVGIVFGVIRFLSDQYLNTGFLGGNTHLMVYLIIITLIGISIGVNLMDYIDSYEFFPMENVVSDFKLKDDFIGYREEFLKVLESLFGEYDYPSFMVVSRILQIGIFAIVIYGFLIERWVIFSWSVFSLIFAISPDIFKRNTGYNVPSVIYLWTTLVIFLYAFGRPMGFYRYFYWWPGITHFLTGTLVAVLVFSLLVYSGRVSKNLYIPSYFIPLIVLFSIFSIGVIWEISEFFVDVSFEMKLQAGIEDTVFDLLCNFGGTVFSLILIYNMTDGWTSRETGKKSTLIQSIKKMFNNFKKGP